MKTRALPLEGWEVRAILAGSKSRIITPVVPQPFDREGVRIWSAADGSGRKVEVTPLNFEQYAPAFIAKFCPYGQAGDLAWVQEAFLPPGDDFITDSPDCLLYAADPLQHKHQRFHKFEPVPAVEMARADSRLTLQLASVQVLRLSKLRWLDFTGDASYRLLNEGGTFRGDAKQAFYEVFDRRRCWGVSTADDPMLWVVRFESIQMNIDELLAREKAA